MALGARSKYFGTEMGIKFHCPNGHRLNVKSFLGGKRAICPKCGARVVVPLASETAHQGDEPTLSAETSISEALLASPYEEVAQDVAARGGVTRGVVRSGAAATDAFAEAPGAVWYVRPTTGGQFGPASTDIMRAWVNEGRVAASTLVWRAGWPEWRTAGGVFPQLAATLPLEGAWSASGANAPRTSNGGSLPHGQVVQSIAVGQSSIGPQTLSAGAPPLAQSARRRRRQHDRRLYASAVLVVVSIILLIVLAVVFRRQSDAPETPSQEATTNKSG